MATTERHRVYYDHIVHVWLNPDPDSNDQFSPSEILQRGLGIVLFVCHVLINIYVVHT